MSKPNFLQAIKIQARAVVPIVKALEADMGKQRAHELVGSAIAESWADHVCSRPGDKSDHPRGAADGGFPVESIIVTDAPDEYSVDMQKCAFAEYFRSIGEPETGALLTCGVDFAVERRLRPDWDFKRTQTLMQGADYCDFRWTRKIAE